MVIAARCVPVQSSWVHQFVLTCDDKLAVQFKNGVCCLYPTSNRGLFDIAIASPSPGKFVHRFLYKLLPYRLIKPPCPAQDCGAVQTNCCPDAVPATLYATISGGGPCDGSYALTYDAADPSPAWKSTQAVGNCNAGTTIRFACTSPSNLWVLTVGVSPTSAYSTSCSPFAVSFAFDLTACGGTSNATITVTP